MWKVITFIPNVILVAIRTFRKKPELFLIALALLTSPVATRRHEEKSLALEFEPATTCPVPFYLNGTFGAESTSMLTTFEERTLFVDAFERRDSATVTELLKNSPNLMFAQFIINDKHIKEDIFFLENAIFKNDHDMVVAFMYSAFINEELDIVTTAMEKGFNIKIRNRDGLSIVDLCVKDLLNLNSDPKLLWIDHQIKTVSARKYSAIFIKALIKSLHQVSSNPSFREIIIRQPGRILSKNQIDLLRGLKNALHRVSPHNENALHEVSLHNHGPFHLVNSYQKDIKTIFGMMMGEIKLPHRPMSDKYFSTSITIAVAIMISPFIFTGRSLSRAYKAVHRLTSRFWKRKPTGQTRKGSIEEKSDNTPIVIQGQQPVLANSAINVGNDTKNVNLSQSNVTSSVKIEGRKKIERSNQDEKETKTISIKKILEQKREEREKLKREKEKSKIHTTNPKKNERPVASAKTRTSNLTTKTNQDKKNDEKIQDGQRKFARQDIFRTKPTYDELRTAELKYTEQIVKEYKCQPDDYLTQLCIYYNSLFYSLRYSVVTSKCSGDPIDRNFRNMIVHGCTIPIPEKFLQNTVNNLKNNLKNLQLISFQGTALFNVLYTHFSSLEKDTAKINRSVEHNDDECLSFVTKLIAQISSITEALDKNKIDPELRPCYITALKWLFIMCGEINNKQRLARFVRQQLDSDVHMFLYQSRVVRDRACHWIIIRDSDENRVISDGLEDNKIISLAALSSIITTDFLSGWRDNNSRKFKNNENKNSPVVSASAIQDKKVVVLVNGKLSALNPSAKAFYPSAVATASVQVPTLTMFSTKSNSPKLSSANANDSDMKSLQKEMFEDNIKKLARIANSVNPNIRLAKKLFEDLMQQNPREDVQIRGTHNIIKTMARADEDPDIGWMLNLLEKIMKVFSAKVNEKHCYRNILIDMYTYAFQALRTLGKERFSEVNAVAKNILEMAKKNQLFPFPEIVRLQTDNSYIVKLNKHELSINVAYFWTIINLSPLVPIDGRQIIINFICEMPESNNYVKQTIEAAVKDMIGITSETISSPHLFLLSLRLMRTTNENNYRVQQQVPVSLPTQPVFAQVPMPPVVMFSVPPPPSRMILPHTRRRILLPSSDVAVTPSPLTR